MDKNIIDLNENQIKALSDRHAFNCTNRYKSNNLIIKNNILICPDCGYPLTKLNDENNDIDI